MRLYTVAVVMVGVAPAWRSWRSRSSASRWSSRLGRPDASASTSGTTPSWSSIALALSLATLAYTGLETITNFAAEVREPGRTLPRSLFLGIGDRGGAQRRGLDRRACRPIPAEPDPAAPGRRGQRASATEWLQAPLVGIATAIGDELPGGGDAFEVFVGVVQRARS